MAGSVILPRTGDIGDDHRPTAQPGLTPPKATISVIPLIALLRSRLTTACSQESVTYTIGKHPNRARWGAPAVLLGFEDTGGLVQIGRAGKTPSAAEWHLVRAAWFLRERRDGADRNVEATGTRKRGQADGHGCVAAPIPPGATDHALAALGRAGRLSTYLVVFI
jgi:hypothetical protein